MPNLNYDPKNPSDLLGRPIAEGDMVAWAHTYGRSPAMGVMRIKRINFTCEVDCATGYGKKRVACDQRDADKYTLRLVPVKSTGWVTGEPSSWRAMETTALLPMNVVKLEPFTDD